MVCIHCSHLHQIQLLKTGWKKIQKTFAIELSPPPKKNLLFHPLPSLFTKVWKFISASDLHNETSSCTNVDEHIKYDAYICLHFLFMSQGCRMQTTKHTYLLHHLILSLHSPQGIINTLWGWLSNYKYQTSTLQTTPSTPPPIAIGIFLPPHVSLEHLETTVYFARNMFCFIFEENVNIMRVAA